MVPIAIVIILFLIVQKKLALMGKKLHQSEPSGSFVGHKLKVSSGAASKVGAQESLPASRSDFLLSSAPNEKKLKRRQHRQERNLAFQFLAINTLEFVSAGALICINLYLFIPNFNTTYYSLRQFLRIVGNTCQSLIPIVTLLFNAKKLKN